jgi:hypothetical protein
MNNIPTRFGIPDMHAPRSLDDLRGYFWFGGIGLLLCLLGVVSYSVAGRWIVVGLLAFWLLLSARELRKRPKRDRTTSVLYRNCLLVVVAFCIGFAVWAWQLGLPWAVVIGGLFLIDAFANALASVTDWWRLSLIGHAAGLAICGFAFPFVEPRMLGVLLGVSLVAGSSLSAAILYWQVRHARYARDLDQQLEDELLLHAAAGMELPTALAALSRNESASPVNKGAAE